jgi:hypothetical protein
VRRRRADADREHVEGGEDHASDASINPASTALRPSRQTPVFLGSRVRLPSV